MRESQLLDNRSARLRADAERNRVAIVSAARHLFAEAGMDVLTGKIARRAGVAVSTVYRHFSSREALIEVVFADQHAECWRFLAMIENHPDPWLALSAGIRRFCDDQVNDKGFTARLLLIAGSGDTHPPEVVADIAARSDRLDGIIRHAKESGAVGADISRADIQLLIAGNAGVITATAPADVKAASRRYVDLILRSFEA